MIPIFNLYFMYGLVMYFATLSDDKPVEYSDYKLCVVAPNRSATSATA